MTRAPASASAPTASIRTPRTISICSISPPATSCALDAKTKQPTVYLTPTPNSHPRRGTVDDQGRLWFAEYFGNAIGMLDPETGKIQEWKVPTPWSSPYDAVRTRMAMPGPAR